MTSHQVSELVSGLKSRHADARRKAIRELYHFAKTELRELPQETLSQVLDDFNQQIHVLLTGYDVNEKRAGILTIVCLIGGDTETTKTRTIRYANYLRNLFPSSDSSILELAAKTLGRLATTLGVKRAEFIEQEIKRASEWLTEDRSEGKRLSAVLIFKELAVAMPSYFFLHINTFFNHIVLALRDPKEQIREAAAKALRTAFSITAQRENPKHSNKAHWYLQCYEEATTSFADLSLRERGLTRDDHVHGALLILNELLRCSNSAWESTYTSLMQKLDHEQDSSDEISSIYMKSHFVPSPSHPEEGSTAAVLYESSICRQLVTEKYEKICSDVMAQQISRAQSIHQMLLLMIPRLAAFNRALFSKKHLKSTINHLITFLGGREKEKAMAFTTLGLISVAVESDILQYKTRIVDIVKQSLKNRDTSKKRQISEGPLLNCITLLGCSMKENISADFRDILEAMCTTGLSHPLTVCFKELCQHVPSLKRDITDRMLNILSIILRKKPCLPAGAAAVAAAAAGSEQARLRALLAEPSDAAQLVMALRTLGSFDFEWQHVLMSFVRRCTEHYLRAEPQELRLEAVRTAAKLLVKAADRASVTHSKTLQSTIDEAIGKLLSVGLADCDHEVRYRVFEIFTDPVFDYYLAQEHNLNVLFMAINDEHAEVREMIMCTVGRLSALNPSYVLPNVRQMYIHFLIELQHSGMTRSKERATRMLNILISSAPTSARPYVDTILNVLVPKLSDADSGPPVVVSILKAIGDIADVCGEGSALNKWLPGLIEVMYGMLSDANSSDLRNVALWSFGQVIAATGHVVTPYMEYPNLMNTLLGFLKTEQQVSDRRETIRVLGLLGALDPYKHKANRGLEDSQNTSILIPVTNENSPESLDTNVSEMLVNMSPLVLDEFYPAIAVTSLMRILRDATLAQHHTNVVHSLTFIFQSLGIKCVPYIPRVMPSLLHVIRNTENANFREFLLTQLASLVSIVKIHIRNYLGQIFDLIRDFWLPNSNLQPTLIMLVEHIAVALGSEFQIYLPKILPQILKVLYGDASKDRYVTEKLLLAMQKFENNLDDVLQLVVPAITKLFDSKDVPQSVARLAMETMEQLSLYVNLKPFASRIIHPLSRVIENQPNLRATAMNTVCAMVLQLGRDYNDFIPGMEKLLLKHKVQCQSYVVLVTRLQLPSTLASDDNYLDEARSRLRNKRQDVVAPTDAQTIKKLAVNAANLRRSWRADARYSREDWSEWQRRLSVALLDESHSPALRACSTLALNYPPLAAELFNAAFMSCWTELDAAARADLVAALEVALDAEEAAAAAATVLNLAEFMEHCEKGCLPISVKKLGDRAISCRAYAKALYYKEEEYRQNPSSQAVEALIHINNKLQQKEAANGLLEKVMRQDRAGDSVGVHVRWYEKLHNWDQALDLYNKKLETEPHDSEARLGQMRCLEALGEWDKLHDFTSEQWDEMSGDFKRKSAKIASAAAWGLQEWDSMRKFVDLIPENSQDGAFYRAILAIHNEEWAESRNFVDKARSLLDPELTAVAGESYQRAYASLVNAQLLVELEEVVSYKLIEEKRNVLRQAWWMRLQGGQRLVEDWRRMLQIRSLVLSPREDFITWLKYSSLCRKNGALTQANKVLTSVLGNDPLNNLDLLFSLHESRVVLTYTKNLWDGGERRFAYDLLQRYIDGAPNGDDEHCRLLARCHLKLGSWCEQLQDINDLSLSEILRNYVTATALAPDWYKAWHSWAYMNYEAVLYYKQQDNTSESSLTGSSSEKKATRGDFITQYIVAAVDGFFKAISLSGDDSLQDTLRLLTLWFDYGHHPPVYETLFDGLRKIEINIWLQVIPQLIARIDSPRPLVAKLVHSLLTDVGKFHPQALVYPLTVASKSSFATRKAAANQILKSMCGHSQTLVAQAAIISEELIRVAILWHDQWFIALDEASRLYYSERDVRGMLRSLEPMHALLDRGPQTLKEHSFVQMYGRDLREARDWCARFKETADPTFLNAAWDLYYHVFRRISAQFRSLTSLELQYVSPRLLGCRDLELAVPGSYVPGQEITRISYIHSNLQVIKSKQRPRRLVIRGSAGADYMFLLKGHEDLRQDERVMQLFGLVNALLQASACRQDLNIQRYAVVPLSTNSGLIGWVPHCDTLYNLISEHRAGSPERRQRNALTHEQQLMTRMSSDLSKLMLMQKVEVFEHTLAATPGNELARLLWLKSPSAEVWFERRNNFTRSLAVMSMVGYILGLGDRHPSNIMLQRASGKVLHIDFGDCFEVTLTRDKFPEKIPFRLTRMLINAMEVTGIEGTYRRTCEQVMRVLHRHKDSVMAVLEAFVYDPLLNWRLVDNGRHSMSDGSLGSSEASASTLPSRSRRRARRADESLELSDAAANRRALAIVNRIRDKLTGRDFPLVAETVSVPQQVELLIRAATDNENLCQCYVGWCPFW